jgi:acetyl-CoA/propionyl-CoA carboxylase biotin carboxyl carrier protein
MLRRVLIANRGEIAVRIMRTCRQMGIATVAVHSEADAHAPHVAAADQAVAIGPPPAVESYLRIPAILEAARATGADAIHPGYGFLSENADFAESCEQAGIRFVGPPAAVIRRMGSKTAAREAMSAAGVPVVPGGTPASQADADIAAAVESAGLPALIKASAGGGGKGMRTVRSRAEIGDAIGAARREAERAFGDGTLYVERLIERARHVEVQVLGDAHGQVVHLFERDCSLQRRHQKVIEEAPAPALTPRIREAMTAAAVAAARAVGYVNAGTFEFLLEGEGDAARFYFLEMNTRLQVEHPVTEAVTGVDLVKAQLIVAAGEPLPFTQDEIRLNGHAIECRVYAEDSRRLLPQSGRLLRYVEPAGEGIRVDSGVAAGQVITVHYDPLLAKLIAWAPDRASALARARAAIAAYEMLGLRHNLAFLDALLALPDVAAADTHTRLIESRLDELAGEPDEARRAAAAAVAAVAAAIGPGRPAAALGEARPVRDPWDLLGPVIW